MREGTTYRRLLAGAAIPVLLLAAQALGAPPGVRPAVVPTSLGLTPLRTSQQAILQTGALRIQVRSGAPGLVAVRGRAQVGDAPPVRVGGRKRLRFDQAGRRNVSLPLSRSGKRLLSSCRAAIVVFTATLKPREATTSVAGRNRGYAAVPIAVDRPECSSSPARVPGTAAGTGGGGGGDRGGGGDGGGGPADAVPPPQPYAGPPIDTTAADRCDFLDPAVCLQPWPNDYFTVADPSTETGRRLNLKADSMPANKLGVHIDPAEYDRLDGFSPGNLITVRIPGLDNPQAFHNTDPVSVDQMVAYSEPDQPIVVINADTGERQPIWSEIDYNAIDPATGRSADDPADRANVNLLIRPAVNWDEGGHYIVALRYLRDAQDDPIQSTDAFRVYRDNLITGDPAIESRRAHMEELFADLGDAGVRRSNLYLAWDFTVASERSLASRVLKIRDDALAQLGDANLSDMQVQGRAPGFSIDASQTENFTPAENPNIARIVHGTLTVPCYMNTPACLPVGSTYNLGADGLPSQLLAGTPLANTASVSFECIIPHSALDAGDRQPARVSLYGHGLLGSASEVEGGNVEAMANEHDIVFCATDWYGFATQNLPNILLILQDLSLFPLLADETQQGFLNFLYLGRLMIHPHGLTTNAAFHDTNGDPVIDTNRLFYDGNSQGGILGGALTALAPDFDRAVLGVPGMNYSTLLQRSVDFEPYAEGKFTSEACDLLPSPLDGVCSSTAPGDTPLGLYDNYPNELERPLIFSLMQLLWDRAEADGYAHHITDDPLPNTPPHEVLLHVAFGDHQVANVSAEVEARTIGASIYQPALEPGRYWNPNGVFGIPAIGSFPFSGSALVYWDGGPVVLPDNPNGGTATPPNEDIPPRPTYGCGMTGPPACGADPHSYPRNDVKARAQKSDFLQVSGVVNNYCTTDNPPDLPFSLLVPNTGISIPCHSHGWPGPGP